MPKVTTEQIVIDAVRCSLNCGDYSTAESYLNSSVRSSKNPEILAHVNLYSVWSDLCRAKNVAETSGSVATLKVYAESESMKSVRPAVLLTLWYITGQGQYSDSHIHAKSLGKGHWIPAKRYKDMYDRGSTVESPL